MRILFAVGSSESNNGDIVDVILNEYQKNYKKIISYKRAFYYNAVLDEIRNSINTDSKFDLIIMSEDLEKNNTDSYEIEDLNLYKHMDELTDEAYKEDGTGIPIILICSDRRTERDPIIKKLFVLGVYNILIGRERTIQNVCALIDKPRNKRTAKIVYRIDPNSTQYESGTKIQKSVSDKELLSIIKFFNVNRENVNKCVRGFAKLASEKNESQLQTIINNLPLDVRIILEENSQEYMKIAKVSVKNSNIENKPNYESRDLVGGSNNSGTTSVIIPNHDSKKGIFKRFTEDKKS